MTDSRELPEVLEPIARGEESTLVDLVDSLLNQGLMADGDLVLGLAGIDLIYLRLSVLLAAADRVLPHARLPAPAAQEIPAAQEVPAAHEIPAAPEKPTAPEAPAAHETPAADDLPAADLPPPAEPTPRSREHVHPVEQAELEAVSEDLARRPEADRPMRFDPDPEEVRRSVMKLVLTLVELIRDLLERQALRRMEAETLTEDEVERLGQALMKLEETVHELAAQFGIDPDELNLDLGPLGKLR